MSARKLAVILLSIGYLTAAHCRAACAFSSPVSVAVEEHDSDCRHEEGESKGHDSKAPCCTTLGGDQAMLPSAAPVLAPQAVAASFVIMPRSGHPEDMTPRFRASKQNHDPPRISSEVLSLASLSPRAPPAVL